MWARWSHYIFFCMANCRQLIKWDTISRCQLFIVFVVGRRLARGGACKRSCGFAADGKSLRRCPVLCASVCVCSTIMVSIHASWLLYATFKFSILHTIWSLLYIHKRLRRRVKSLQIYANEITFNLLYIYKIGSGI